MTEYEWNEMPCVSSVFADKVEEINKHFDLLDKLSNTPTQIRSSFDDLQFYGVCGN